MLRLTLLDHLRNRIKREALHKYVLSDFVGQNLDVVLDATISILFLYTSARHRTAQFTEIASTVGHKIRKKLNLSTDSAAAVKMGAFVIYSFQEAGIVSLEKVKGKRHNVYALKVLDHEALLTLWETVMEFEADKMPQRECFKDWEAPFNENRVPIIKTRNREVIEYSRKEVIPIAYETLNRAQHIGWVVDEELLLIQEWALQTKQPAFDEIWNALERKARETKLREAKTIIKMAKTLIGVVFYHSYNLDFRGRKYVSTAYLHEQGSDPAKGLLRFAERKALGQEGFKWLCISIANNYAGGNPRSDKLPLDERVQWVLKREGEIIEWATDPINNTGWMAADKPWQCLSACIELRRLREYQGRKMDFENFDYKSNLLVYIDGANNGSQHLAALTRDENTARLVNLMPTPVPEDLYMEIGNLVWETLEKIVADYSVSERMACEQYIDKLTDLKRTVASTEAETDKLALTEFRSDNALLGEIAWPIFWLRIHEAKDRRKIVKRNVMTLPYGGTPYGLGTQQIEDAARHGIEMLRFVEESWAAKLGRLVFNVCKERLDKGMLLLTIFEGIGAEAEKRGEFLTWKVPLTNFMVTQHYTEGIVKKVWVQYGPTNGLRKSTGYFENTLQLSVCFIENTVASKRKQAQGASPNIIHSLDAAHLMLIVNEADFSVATVHDSFGALCVDMPELFEITREMFIKLYSQPVLEDLFKQFKVKLDFPYGNLDINTTRDAEYAFA
jgi:hypothetical protein